MLGAMSRLAMKYRKIATMCLFRMKTKCKNYHLSGWNTAAACKIVNTCRLISCRVRKLGMRLCVFDCIRSTLHAFNSLRRLPPLLLLHSYIFLPAKNRLLHMFSLTHIPPLGTIDQRLCAWSNCLFGFFPLAVLPAHWYTIAVHTPQSTIDFHTWTSTDQNLFSKRKIYKLLTLLQFDPKSIVISGWRSAYFSIE